MSKQLVVQFMLLQKLERNCGKEGVLPKIKQSKPGRLIKLRFRKQRRRRRIWENQRRSFLCGTCRQYTSYVTFSHAANTHSLLHITLHGSRMCWCASSHPHGHPCHAPECCLFSPYSSSFSQPCVSPISSSSTLTLTCTPSSSLWTSSGQHPTGTPPTEESGPLAEKRPSHRL